jgi:hypothetical protein
VPVLVRPAGTPLRPTARASPQPRAAGAGKPAPRGARVGARPRPSKRRGGSGSAPSSPREGRRAPRCAKPWARPSFLRAFCRPRFPVGANARQSRGGGQASADGVGSTLRQGATLRAVADRYGGRSDARALTTPLRCASRAAPCGLRLALSVPLLRRSTLSASRPACAPLRPRCARLARARGKPRWHAASTGALLLSDEGLDELGDFGLLTARKLSGRVERELKATLGGGFWPLRRNPQDLVGGRA